MALESHPTPLTVKQRSFFACKRGDAGASIQSAIGYVDCEFPCIDTATESHALCKKPPQIIYISINDVILIQLHASISVPIRHNSLHSLVAPLFTFLTLY